MHDETQAREILAQFDVQEISTEICAMNNAQIRIYTNDFDLQHAIDLPEQIALDHAHLLASLFNEVETISEHDIDIVIILHDNISLCFSIDFDLRDFCERAATPIFICDNAEYYTFDDDDRATTDQPRHEVRGEQQRNESLADFVKRMREAK